MLARVHFMRCRWPFLLGFVPAVVCLYMLAGCGGESSTKPAPVDQAQQKKAQEYMAGYREQIIDSNKEKAKAKGAVKKTP